MISVTALILLLVISELSLITLCHLDKFAFISMFVFFAFRCSGMDIVGLLGKVGFGQSILDSKVATGASTFVIAYAIHKLFVPARMATTLAATPLIVRYLRRIGFLKQPVSKV